MNPKKLALAAALTLLAAPSAATAATPAGSDMQRAGAAQAIVCDAYPCTLAQQTFEGYDHRWVPSGVITSWSAELGAGSSARLRVLRESGLGFEPVGQSEVGAAGATGGVETFATRIPVDAGPQVLAVDLTAGRIGTEDHAAADDDTRSVFFQPALGDATRAEDGGFAQELMLSAVVEPDVDVDGFGDETQDPCVGCAQPGSGGGGAPGGEVPSPPPSERPGGDDSAQRKHGPQLTIGPKAILRPGSAGRQGWVDVYVENDGDANAEGTIAIQQDRKTLWKQDAEIDWGDRDSWGNFKVKGAALKALRTKGSLKLTSVASWRDASGKAVTVRKPLTILRGGATGYDGYYKGAGPLVISVEQGVITAIDIELNAFCARSSKHVMRAFGRVDGFPALIAPDGSFSARGRSGGDEVKYRGKLSKNGTGKGYLSLFHTEMWIGPSGRFETDTCADARNWTVKRTR